VGCVWGKSVFVVSVRDPQKPNDVDNPTENNNPTEIFPQEILTDTPQPKTIRSTPQK
jgi:hypothetical protein